MRVADSLARFWSASCFLFLSSRNLVFSCSMFSCSWLILSFSVMALSLAMAPSKLLLMYVASLLIAFISVVISSTSVFCSLYCCSTIGSDFSTWL